MNAVDSDSKTGSVEQVEGIASVDRSEWDRLAGDNPFASYGWLRTIEETGKVPARHRIFLLRRGNDLVAGAPCFFQHPGDPTVTMDYVLFGRLKQLALFLRLTALPALISGARVGWHNTILVKPELPSDLRTRAIEKIVNLQEKTAMRDRLVLFHRGIMENEQELKQVLNLNRLLKMNELPQARLDIEWNSFKEYRQHLKKTHPATEKNIRLEINRAKKGGLVVRRLENPATMQNRLHGIMDRHSLRLNGVPFPYSPGFFERLKENLGDRAIVYVAENKSELIGVLIMLRSNDTAFLPMIGVDRERSAREKVFFNLIFNQPIRDAIETGINRIHYGKLLYDLKIRRGCKLIKNDLYVRARSPVQKGILRAICCYHNRRVERIIASVSGEKHGNAGNTHTQKAAKR